MVPESEALRLLGIDPNEAMKAYSDAYRRAHPPRLSVWQRVRRWITWNLREGDFFVIVRCVTCGHELEVSSLNEDETGPYFGKPCPCGKSEASSGQIRDCQSREKRHHLRQRP